MRNSRLAVTSNNCNHKDGVTNDIDCLTYRIPLMVGLDSIPLLTTGNYSLTSHHSQLTSTKSHRENIIINV